MIKIRIRIQEITTLLDIEKNKKETRVSVPGKAKKIAFAATANLVPVTSIRLRARVYIWLADEWFYGRFSEAIRCHL